MIDLTKNNYLYGVGHNLTWDVHVGPPNRKVMTYFEETVESTKTLHEKVGGPWTLLYSGGLDSQFVFNVLRYIGIPFNTVIINIRDNNGLIYNAEETVHAFEHCSSNNVIPHVVNFNYEQFLDTGEIIEIAKESCIGSFRIPATLKVASQQDGFVVLGNDPPYMKNIGGRWHLEETEVIHSQFNFYKNRKIEGTPFLLSYTPEMMLSFLLDPTIVNLAHGRSPGKQGTNSSKVDVFNNGSGFNMVNYNFDQNKPKLTGYEKIVRTEHLINHPSIKYMEENFRPLWDGKWYEDYFSIVKRLSIYE